MGRQIRHALEAMDTLMNISVKTMTVCLLGLAPTNTRSCLFLSLLFLINWCSGVDLWFRVVLQFNTASETLHFSPNFVMMEKIVNEFSFIKSMVP